MYTHIFIFSLFYISPNYICSIRFAIFQFFLIVQNISIDRSVPNQITIQDVTVPMKTNSKHPEMIPNPLFFEIPSHTLALRDMLRDLASGERHLLLLGPQGCGKNKLADYLLHLLQVSIQAKERASRNGALLLST